MTPLGVIVTDVPFSIDQQILPTLSIGDAE